MDTNTVSFDCVILTAQETINQLSPFSSEIPSGISIVELRMVWDIFCKMIFGVNSKRLLSHWCYDVWQSNSRSCIGSRFTRLWLPQWCAPTILRGSIIYRPLCLKGLSIIPPRALACLGNHYNQETALNCSLASDLNSYNDWDVSVQNLLPSEHRNKPKNGCAPVADHAPKPVFTLLLRSTVNSQWNYEPLSGNLYKLNITGAISGVTNPRPEMAKDLIAAIILDGASGKSGPGT